MADLSWPAFLDLLDVDPEKAFDEFYRYATILLTTQPPHPLQQADADHRQDLIHEVILHCVRGDFQVLRRYENRGRPFAAWLYTIAHHRTSDILRRERRGNDCLTPIHATSDGPPLEGVLENPGPSSESHAEFAELVDVVKRIMGQIGDYCRLLLELAADEFTPREMVVALRLSAGENKKVSDDLRYCREKLKNRLAEAGINFKELFDR